MPASPEKQEAALLAAGHRVITYGRRTAAASLSDREELSASRFGVDQAS
jgi:hypothetical protein